MNATTKQQLALSKIRHLWSCFSVDMPRGILALLNGNESSRVAAMNIVDAWWHECFFSRYRRPNDPRMDFVFAVAYYVRGDYDRSIHRSCVCEGELNGFGDVRKAHEYYRSRLAEAESLVGELVIEPPETPTVATCGCDVCVAAAS